MIHNNKEVTGKTRLEEIALIWQHRLPLPRNYIILVQMEVMFRTHLKILKYIFVASIGKQLNPRIINMFMTTEQVNPRP
jgi:hypothetical protein